MGTYCKVLFLFCFTVFSGMLSGQDNGGEVNLSTPREAIETHIKYTGDDNFQPDVAAKALNIQGSFKATPGELAIKLVQIYKGKGIDININEVPDTPDYVDSASGAPCYYPVEENKKIYLQKYGNQWKYSASTVRRIPEMHKEVYPFGTYKLLNLLPKSSDNKFLGLFLWQYLLLLIVIAICFILYLVVVWIVEKLFVPLVLRKGLREIARDFIHPVAKPVSLLIVVSVLSLLVPVLQFPLTVNKYIYLTMRALVPLFGTIVVYKMVDIVAVYMDSWADKTDSQLDDQLVPIIRKMLKVFVVLTGFLFILQNLHFNITALLAGLSIGGIAFALAAQDTIKNLFGSLMIFVDRPFHVGDWISFDTVNGTVEEVGFRSTRIRTFHNSLIAIPNGKLADLTIDNMQLRQYRRFLTTIAITYDTPPELIEAYVEGLRKIVANHPDTRKDYYNVYLNEFGSHSLNIIFYIFFELNDYSLELKARHEVIMDAVRLADELGVRFAFPTQTVHMESFPGQGTLTPEYQNLDKETLRKKVDSFVGYSSGR